jgi:hypothetical protein
MKFVLITFMALSIEAPVLVGQAAGVVNSSRSNIKNNLVVSNSSPGTVQRYTEDGLLLSTIATVPNGIAMAKNLGNYMFVTGTSLVQVTPTGGVSTVANAPATAVGNAQWVAIVGDGLSNVLLGDNRTHAVWLANSSNVVAKIANYPVGATSVNEDIALAVDPSGNYLVLEDNNSTLHLHSITPTGTVTSVTLTGASAQNSGKSLVSFNGGYVFVSAADNAVYQATLTTPLNITSPAATITQVASGIASNGNVTSVAVDQDSGVLYVSTSSGPIVATAIKTAGNGTVATFMNEIASLSNAQDVITESYGDLPHLAAGNIWTTGFYILNTGIVPATYAINFYGDSGSPVALPFANGNATSLTGTLPAQGMTYVEASNSAAALLEGTGLISADPTITVQALFRDSAGGGIYYEASVPASGGDLGFAMPFDFTTFAPTGAQLYTGLAIGNLDPANAATVTCVATNQAGVVIPNAVTIPQLPPLGHFAGFQFPALYGTSGTLTCLSNTLIAALGVRSLGTTFSTLPVQNSRAVSTKGISGS